MSCMRGGDVFSRRRGALRGLDRNASRIHGQDGIVWDGRTQSKFPIARVECSGKLYQVSDNEVIFLFEGQMFIMVESLLVFFL